MYDQYELEHIPSVFILDDQGNIIGSAEGEKESLALLKNVPVAAAYADEGSPAESSEIYVGDNYDENYNISPFERGRCTDSYSKAWCDSHGFANNRPVPHKVKLIPKEEACLRDLYVAGTAGVIAGYVKSGPGGALYATAAASYRLFTCLF